MKVQISVPGKPFSVGLVGCTFSRAGPPRPALELYHGAITQAAVTWCLFRTNRTFLISPSEGLMDLANVVRPQDRHMASLSRVEQDIWGHEIVGALAGLFPVTRLKVVLVAGTKFVAPVARAVMSEEYTWDIEVPFAEMTTMQRLEFFGFGVSRGLQGPTHN